MRLTFFTLSILGSLVLLQSCRKDKLEGEKEILEGKWQWGGSLVFYDDIGSPNDPPRDTIFAGECYDIYELDFLEKGIVKSLKNGKVKKRKRIVFDRFKECPQNGALSIVIHLGGVETNSASEFEKSIEVTEETEDDLGNRTLNFVNMWPNPTKNLINLEYSEEIESYIIYDMQGRICKEGPISSLIDLRNLKSGVYAISFQQKSNKRITKQSIIE